MLKKKKKSNDKTACTVSNVLESSDEIEVEMYGQKVINLSKSILNNSEKSLLYKGLKYCPTQKVTDIGVVRKDLDKFHDSLRTKEFFNRSQNPAPKSITSKLTTTATVPKSALDKISPYGNATYFLKIRKKSNWRPHHGSANLETFINVNEMDLGKSHFPRTKNQNVTKSEREALKLLARDPEITIKPADKGGSIVIMNTVDYMKEANRQLNDETTYKTLEKDPTIKFNDEVELKLNNMVADGDIAEGIRKILSNNAPRTPLIYFLPKIHKGKIPPPGRPSLSQQLSNRKNLSLCRQFPKP